MSELDTRTFEQKIAAHRVAKALTRHPELKALDDDMEFRFALEKLEPPKLAGFDLELKL